MFNYSLSLLLCITCIFSARATEEPALDFVGLKDYAIGPYLYYYPDVDNFSTIQHLVALKHSGKFMPWGKSAVFNLGFTDKVCCVSFKAYNSGSIPQITLFSVYDDLRRLKLYLVNKDSIIEFPSQSYYQHNSLRPYNQRLLSYQITVYPKDTLEFFALLDNRDANLYTPIDFGTLEYFMPYEVDYHWNYGLYMGILIFSFFCALVFFILLRKKLFLVYCVFIFSWLVVFVQEEFFLAYFLGEKAYSFFSLLIQSPFFLLAIICNYKVISYLHIISFSNNRVAKTASLVVFFLLGYIVFAEVIALFFYADYLLLQSIVRITNTLNLCIESFIFLKLLYDTLVKREFPTMLYFFVSIVYFIGCFNFNLNSFAILNLNILKPNGIVVGVSIEAIYFAIVIIYRQIQIMRNETALKIDIEKQKAEHQQKIQQTEQEERKRIAYEIHDHLGGLMGALKLSFTGNDSVHTLKLIEKANDDVRNIAHQLMPLDILEIGLLESFKKYISGMKNSAMHFSLYLHGNDALLDTNTQIECFRILSELVTNAVRHSGGNNCRITARQQPDTAFFFEVADNGVGYSGSSPGGLGLKSIRSRLEKMNSQLFVHPGKEGSVFSFTIRVTKHCST